MSPWAKRRVCQVGARKIILLPRKENNDSFEGGNGWGVRLKSPPCKWPRQASFERGSCGGYCASISRVFSSRTARFRAPVHLLKISPLASMKMVVGMPKT